MTTMSRKLYICLTLLLLTYGIVTTTAHRVGTLIATDSVQPPLPTTAAANAATTQKESLLPPNPTLSQFKAAISSFVSQIKPLDDSKQKKILSIPRVISGAIELLKTDAEKQKAALKSKRDRTADQTRTFQTKQTELDHEKAVMNIMRVCWTSGIPKPPKPKATSEKGMQRKLQVQDMALQVREQTLLEESNNFKQKRQLLQQRQSDLQARQRAQQQQMAMRNLQFQKQKQDLFNQINSTSTQPIQQIQQFVNRTVINYVAAPDKCAILNTCYACVAMHGCGWCESSHACMRAPMSNSTTLQISNRAPPTTCAAEDWNMFYCRAATALPVNKQQQQQQQQQQQSTTSTTSKTTPSSSSSPLHSPCTSYLSCATCVADPQCGYCYGGTGMCMEKNHDNSSISSSSSSSSSSVTMCQVPLQSSRNLRIATWNLFSLTRGTYSPQQATEILTMINEEGVDVIALQEVDDMLLDLLLQDRLIQQYHFTRFGTGQNPSGLFILSRFPLEDVAYRYQIRLGETDVFDRAAVLMTRPVIGPHQSLLIVNTKLDLNDRRAVEFVSNVLKRHSDVVLLGTFIGDEYIDLIQNGDFLEALPPPTVITSTSTLATAKTTTTTATADQQQQQQEQKQKQEQEQQEEENMQTLSKFELPSQEQNDALVKSSAAKIYVKSFYRIGADVRKFAVTSTTTSLSSPSSTVSHHALKLSARFFEAVC